MQQLSHQTLNSAFVFSVFVTFIVPLGLAWLTPLPLKARDGRAGVIRLMPANVQRAGQHKFSGPTEVFLLLRCGRVRTKWARGTSGRDRDTIACRPWAIEKYSTNLTSIRNAGAFAIVIPACIGNNIRPVLIRTFARNRLAVLSMFSAVPESEFGCGA